MKQMRLTTLLITAALTVSGCGETQDNAPVVQVVPGGNNPLLKHVPADSPYLAGNLAPIPDNVIDRFLERAQPVLDALQDGLTSARADLSSQGDSEDQGKKLVLALLDELDGNLNRTGMESLGFSLQPHAVFYADSAFPIVRIELADAKAVTDLLQRLQDKSGITIPKHEFQGKSYWRLSEQDFHAHDVSHGDSDGDSDGDFDSGPRGGAYLAIQDGHLAMGIFPVSAENELLAAFLGIEIPQSSDAAQRLASINQQYGYQPYMTGVLDMRMLADVFMNPGPVLLSLINDAGHRDALSEQCRAEINGIIEQAPRIIMGTTEINADVIATQYRVETAPSLTQELLALVSGIPAIPAISKSVVELALGIKVGALRDMLRERASALAEMPYKCEKLNRLNEGAQQLLTQLNQPIPPLVNNFLGVRASLNKLPTGKMLPEEASGLLAIHVDKPEMFVGMAQMFLPGMAELDLRPGSPPVAVPADLLKTPGLVAFAAISKNAIGLSLGAGEEAGLPEYLSRQGSEDGTILAVEYDSGAYMHFTRNMSDHMSVEVKAQHASIGAVAEAAQEAYKAMAGRNQLRVRFVSDGIVLDNKMTFK